VPIGRRVGSPRRPFPRRRRSTRDGNERA